MPALGFGTWQIKDDECVAAVEKALEVGYRHIDTADGYHNHEAVGTGIKNSPADREDIFLTSKIWMEDFAGDKAGAAVGRFLEELQTDYLDLILLHWPDRSVPYSETFAALEKKKAEGKVRAIGVANFTEHHLQDVADAGYTIEVNQVELHPRFQQKELRKYCQENNIAVTAYSPLGRGAALDVPELNEIAEKHNATPAQVTLSWMMANDIITIPKSATFERIKENFQATGVRLDETDHERIEDIEQGERIIDPDFADFDY